jgi:hypothetical protein
LSDLESKTTENLQKMVDLLKTAQEKEDFGSSDEEVKDVSDKIEEVSKWFEEQVKA